MTFGPNAGSGPPVLYEAFIPGALWVWLAVDESPGPRGLAGGVIVIATPANTAAESAGAK